MDFSINVAYNPVAKQRFHREARRQLKALAVALELPTDSYEVRSNQGGIAVSGEVTLHGEHIYVQASQFYGHPDEGVLIRTCEGRKDYHGGRNNIVPLNMLNSIPMLAKAVRRVMESALV